MNGRKTETFDSGSVRNLEQIQECEPQGRRSRLSALVLASFGGACIVFAALALVRTPTTVHPEPSDPLGDLVARATGEAEDNQLQDLVADDVTFPGVLSDQDNPTTAMEVVRAEGRARGSRGPALADDQETGDSTYDAPPPATDRLPVIPMPAQDVLRQSEANVPPNDTLRSMARQLAQTPAAGEIAEPGRSGGYQLQVSSFKNQADADGFATVLRRRGHRAYVQAAHVKGRGLWHRVRIGPFKYKRSADIYRQDFEAKERMVTFTVNPPKARIRIGLADDPS
ncbi:MAG: SPOR domain-containing protein [Deltaproteobacteria bacterium]|nr:MAG: SPOR domain-containing protein [Deltaproteobacteria bacterium]